MASGIKTFEVAVKNRDFIEFKIADGDGTQLCRMRKPKAGVFMMGMLDSDDDAAAATGAMKNFFDLMDEETRKYIALRLSDPEDDFDEDELVAIQEWLMSEDETGVPPTSQTDSPPSPQSRGGRSGRPSRARA